MTGPRSGGPTSAPRNPDFPIGRTRDVTEIVLGFARTLRHAGVAASPDRVQATLQAVDHLDVTQPADVYWAGRLTLCADPVDLDRYDAAFHAYFGNATVSERRRHAPEIVRVAGSAFDTEVPSGGDEQADAQSLAARASAQEVLRTHDVATLDARERDELNRLFALLAPRVGRRRSMRHARSHRGPVDLSRTVRTMLRDGGEPGRLAHRTRRTTPRRLVLLIDVSGSMSNYADALLRFAHAATRAAPQTTETFTVGTRLTRVTREMRQRDPDRALAGVARAIPDWSGGTRLGEVLKAFLDRWGQRGTARGAVLVLFSDGWERGDPTLLGEQLHRLARLAHRVIWVNPHKGKDGFAPVTGGMIAALPHIDVLVAGHSFAALERLVEVIAGA